jgi:hypothetical protein
MGRHVACAEPRLAGEWAVERLDRIAVEPSGERVEDQAQADEHDHRSENRRVGERPDDQPLDHHPADERKGDSGEEGEPVRLAEIDQLPGEIGREHRHFALREIEMIDRLVDHDHRERHAGIDRTGRDAGQDLVGE